MILLDWWTITGWPIFVSIEKNANRFFGKNTIIKKSTLSLEPKPEPNGEPITVLFQNQNFCPDWFSFSGEEELHINYENTISQHAEKDEEFKALVKEKRTFKLNTGWIFPEEVELLWELIKSPQCFIKANDTDWVKVIPISQKPLSYDNTRNLHSYVVEFQRASNNSNDDKMELVKFDKRGYLPSYLSFAY